MSNSKEIIIIDDDEEDIELYGILMKDIDSSAQTYPFTKPEEALPYLKRTGRLPDVIILDFNMPRMTGLEFLELLRADGLLRHIRVAVVTTSCSPVDTEALNALGAKCYQKPSNYNEFKALLASIIS